MARHLADPADCPHLDWLACQLDVGIVLGGANGEAATNLACPGSPASHYHLRIAAYTVDRADPGGMAARASRQRRYLRAGNCCPGGSPVHVVGTNSSRTFLVERDPAERRASGRRHRSVWACAC